jgi:hypothetical protein
MYKKPTRIQIKCLDTDPIRYNLAAKYLIAIGVPFYAPSKPHGADKFDNIFPYMLWDGEEITASKSKYSNDEVQVDSFEEFIAFFEIPVSIDVKLNDNYTAVVKRDGTINVGCQTFTFDAMKELYNAVKEMEGDTE